MPKPGGESNKLGNHYEALWTVRALLRIVNEDALAITIEPFGELGEGVEFELKVDDETTEYHQAKRQRSNGWNISSLNSEGVLANFLNHLGRNDTNRCVFVSMDQPKDLRELIENARLAAIYDNFSTNYLDTSSRKDSFQKLKNAWNLAEDKHVFDLAKRIEIRSPDESTLSEEIATLSRSLYEIDPIQVSNAVYQLVTQSLRQTLHSAEIRTFLEKQPYSFPFRNWTRSDLVGTIIESTNERYSASLTSKRILGQQLSRDEVNIADKYLGTPNSKQFLIIGGVAGMGKSEVVHAISELFTSRDWPVLMFRLDVLETLGTTPRQLGATMDLPDSPAIVLGRFAGSRPSMLLIDQLDAVSEVSGRNSSAFLIIEEIIKQARNFPNMKVVLASRTFDIRNDARIAKLVDERVGIANLIEIGPLSEADVTNTLQKSGDDASKLNAAQRELLRTPLYLKLYTEVSGPKNFTGENELYRLYWESKSKSLRKNGLETSQILQCIDSLLEILSDKQVLSVHKDAIRDNYPSECDGLLSEGVLVSASDRLSFFHESFFDYIFARRFVTTDKDLLKFLTDREQHLFLRGLVRQILTHKRAGGDSDYIELLNNLLKSKFIRFHIKRLVFQWVQSFSAPVDREWILLNELSQSTDPATATWSKAAINGVGWFRLLHANGWLQEELNCRDEERETWAANYVSRFVNEAPNEVSAILSGWMDRPDPWPRYALNIAGNVRAGSSRDFVDLYLTSIRRGDPDIFGAVPFAVNSGMLFYSLPDENPSWAVEVLATWVTHFLLKKAADGYPNPFDYKLRNEDELRGDLGDRLEKLVTGAPRDFVDYFLPIIIDLSRKNIRQPRTSPHRDTVWILRTYNTHYNLHEQLLKGLVDSLQLLVREGDDSIESHLSYLADNLDLELSGWILAQVYAENGELYAEQGAELLLRSEAFLALGWSDSSYWISRELIKQITAYCSDDTVLKLEAVVLEFFPYYERKERAGKTGYVGHAQLTLLTGFTVGRLSEAALRRLGELLRRFPEWTEEGQMPQGVRGGIVGPPFTADWEKLSDSAWLRAFEKYSGENQTGRDFLRGGARELSHVLQTQVKSDPDRFAKLIHAIPQEANHLYPQAIIDGLRDTFKSKEAALPDEEAVWSAIRYCHDLSGRPVGRSICSMLHDCPYEKMPKDILEVLSWYAIEDLDPPEFVGSEWNGDLGMAGLNSVRGGAAWAIGGILFKDSDSYAQLADAVESLCTDKSAAVRSQAAYPLLPLLNFEREKSIELFQCLISIDFNGLYSEHFIVEFMSYAIWTHYESLEPIFLQMLSSENTKDQKYAAELICIAASFEPKANEIMQRILSGAVPMREGIAEVASRRIKVLKDKERSESLLSNLFNDQEESVRRIAAGCFSNMEFEAIEKSTKLIESFIDSQAFHDQSFFFFEVLKSAPIHLPDVVCRAFERSAKLLEGVSVEEEVRTGRFSDRNTSILVRLYEGTTNPDVKTRCLDIIDDLAKSQAAYQLEEHLQDFARQF